MFQSSMTRLRNWLERFDDILGEELQRDLATWALKTAMMVECAQNPNKPAILPEECPHLFAAVVGDHIWSPD